MALYAINGEQCVFAADAKPKIIYQCMECKAPVRLRQGRRRASHFYHVQKASRCRLYHRCSDHAILQHQIQKAFFPEEIEIERPFPTIHRIGDLVWDKEKIVFEIQCSNIECCEIRDRILDYQTMGYTVVWLLDDRVFNRRFVQPAELFLRENTLCYFFSFHLAGTDHFYDQLERIQNKKRVQTGSPCRICLSQPKNIPPLAWPETLPTQILKRTAICKRYLLGDLIHRAIQSATDAPLALTLNAWKNKEMVLQPSQDKFGRFLEWVRNWIAAPYLRGLNRLARW